MALKELAAAMAPYRYGSSTTGVKKSTVATSASSGERRNTPASSAWDVPTRTRGSSGGGTAANIRARTPCPSLDAQPAHEERWVRKIFSRSVKRLVSPPSCRLANLSAYAPDGLFPSRQAALRTCSPALGPGSWPVERRRMGIWISVSMSSWVPPEWGSGATKKTSRGFPATSYRFSRSQSSTFSYVQEIQV